ncbi:hypothetical protein IWQ60_005593 [Tieghemiomyces parasiticus]|uniref:Uncharacterized protein n=1 Tax=Tieghemiomyces parasiticus TaxID=78921 RepID=A0A9W8A6N0_9FUNG|nr:hypothetical protein IWQ60_005593 [Tieghemiomyces parasiticus]
MTAQPSTRRRRYLPFGATPEPDTAQDFRIKGVVFDMDGTLVTPMTEFLAEMRDAVGVPPGQDILGYVHDLEEPDRSLAEGILVEIEQQALQEMKIQPGLPQLLKYLTDNQIPKAILTRNNVDSVNHMLENLFPDHHAGHPHHFAFDPILTRSFRPVKPDPAPLFHIAQQWNVQPHELMMVGDHGDDLNCGNNAGAVSVLLRDSVNERFVGIADHCVTSLDAIGDLLRDGFILDPKQPPATKPTTSVAHS